MSTTENAPTWGSIDTWGSLDHWDSTNRRPDTGRTQPIAAGTTTRP